MVVLTLNHHCQVECGVAFIVLSVDVGSICQDELESELGADECRPVERRGLPLVLRVDIEADL